MVELLDKLMNTLYEKSTISHNKKHSEIIEKKLDFKVVVIVDFENYQAIPTDLLDKEYVYYLFCGFVTTKPAQEYRDMLEGYDINIVETKHSGTNFVDNRISMYIGYMFGKYNPKQVILVSNDIDYYEMIRDLKSNGYPVILREPSLTRKQLLKRQTDYFCEPLKKTASNKTKPIDNDMKKLIEFNNGNDVIAASKIRCYLKTVKKLDKSEINKTIEKIRALYKVVEVRGKEEFYKIT